VRLSVQEQAGYFDASIGRSSTDWNMWLRLALLGDVAYVDDPLALYRLHDATISAQTSPSGQRLRCDVRAIARVFSGHTGEIPDFDRTYTQAGAALSIRWLIHAQAAYQAGSINHALGAVVQAFRQSRSQAGTSDWYQLLTSILRRNEYGVYQASRQLMGSLYRLLESTRYGDQVRKLAVPDAEWESTIAGCADTIRRVTEQECLVAAIDKHDPSLLHFSGRKGLHFPETGNYPSDDREAIESIATLPGKGVRYFVIPAFSFWWLDFYRGLAEYLQTKHSPIWSDSRCKIYELQ